MVAAGGVSLTLGLALLAAVVGGSLAALVPGLLLVGAGIGLCFTPLTSIVLADVDPARAGSASGALSTTQQVGFALGVAVTGVMYFGAAADEAFTLSLIQLTGRGGRGHRPARSRLLAGGYRRERWKRQSVPCCASGVPAGG